LRRWTNFEAVNWQKWCLFFLGEKPGIWCFFCWGWDAVYFSNEFLRDLLKLGEIDVCDELQ
jgi:hypothetical protein